MLDTQYQHQHAQAGANVTDARLKLQSRTISKLMSFRLVKSGWSFAKCYQRLENWNEYILKYVFCRGDGGLVFSMFASHLRVWGLKSHLHPVCTGLVCSARALGGFLRLLQLPPTSQKCASTWIRHAKLPLSVNECANVCVMDQHHIQSLFHPCFQFSHDKLLKQLLKMN